MAITSRPILVVQDDALLRTAMSRILRDEGHEVIEAANAEIALALGREHLPSLVVVDDVLPGVDGVGLLSRFRATMREASPPAVLLTCGGPESVRASELGAKESLRKPFQVEELLRAVAAHRRASAPDA